MTAPAPLAVAGPGVLPVLARPADVAALAAAIADAAATRTRLRLVGRGTWLDAGPRVVADAALPLGALTGVVDYVPGDLTLTARAATPLAELQHLTAAEGQLLALDPAGSGDGSLGATVATASAGPLAHAFGGVRDQVIGATFVDGAGRIVRAGGRVVKNVAGFDLVRLVTGAWGTLGALAEVSVRLRPRPARDETLAVRLPAGVHAGNAAALDAWLARLRAAPLAAWALELLNGGLAEHLGLADRPVLLARLAGNDALVAAQRATLAALGDVVDARGEVWRHLAAAEPRVATVVRLSTRPTRLAALAAPLLSRAAGAVGLMVHATPSRGTVRLVLPGDSAFGLPDLDALTRPPLGARVVVERALDAVRPALGDAGRRAWFDAPLERRVRAGFDPAGVLNPSAVGALRG